MKSSVGKAEHKSNDGLRFFHPVQLRAGPLYCHCCDGTVRNIMIGDVEIVRRIYVAVRDKYWNTVAPDIINLVIDKKARSFRFEFDCCHKLRNIRFTWHAVIEGNRSGVITYSMQGEAASSFEYNRIGICVLHPLKECSGKKIVVEKVDGTQETARFPAIISPWQPIKKIRALYQRFGKGIESDLRFEGDTFEMEDQRNWTDASYKTYSPPLKNNIPFLAERGELFSRKVILTVRSRGRVPIKKPGQQRIDVEFRERSCALSGIGTVFSCQPKPIPEKELRLLKNCNFSHLRLDMRFGAADLLPVVRSACALSKSVNVPLELALFFRNGNKEFDQDVRALQKLLGKQDLLVKRFLVFRSGEKVTLPATFNAVIDTLVQCAPLAEIVSGTNGYFVEINRRRPALSGAAGVCYSVNPQVHTYDDDAVIDNLGGQAVTNLCAKTRFPGKDVFITPVTLMPRLVPDSPQKTHGPDPRQKSLFGAAWTLGSIIRLSESGAAGVTYFKTTGDCGIMERGAGRVFPMYHVFADVGEFAGSTMRVFHPERGNSVEACVLEKNGRKRILVANLTREKRVIAIHNLPEYVRVKLLNDRTIHQACFQSEIYRKNRGRKTETIHSTLRVTLGGYGIARIDVSGI
jgi:hypothetical protein